MDGGVRQDRRVLESRGLLAGIVVGLASGTWMVADLQFKGSMYTIHFGSYAVPLYAAIWALALNLVVAFAVSLLVGSSRRSVDGAPLGALAK